jgi:hypothetical protein
MLIFVAVGVLRRYVRGFAPHMTTMGLSLAPLATVSIVVN